MEAAQKSSSRASSFDNVSHDFRPSKVQNLRRLSMETYMVRIYAGQLSQECDFVAVEAEKATPAIDVVQIAARKLRLAGSVEKYELAEVFSSGGQLCKERRLEDMDTPVGVQLLWPKIINAEMDRGMGLFTGYRFYIRRKDPEMSRSGWVECKDQSVVDTFLLSFLQQPMGAKEYQDLCNLPDLNEQTLLHNLKARFSSSKIYTYVGSILIALNPFKFFPIYNPKYVKMYQNRRLGELPPHIFAIADAAYHSMLRMRQNQCIVISGESGSGKTESTNLLLHHLTALSQKGLHGSGVEQTILGAGPVLEAFGNAKTVHNNNSSRFGKFIQVNYKENGMVHGAIVEKYLLEKSRIVSQAKNERNYHVFYYLLAGADEKERETLHLSKPEEYKYLSHSQCFTLEGVDEEHEFARLRQSMEMVGFSPETQRKIFCVLSAVLHLGNVEFKKKGDQHHDESVTVRNEATVKIISNLLKVKEKTVLEALTQKRTTAGDETFTINYKMEEAVATRDAMAKCIYGALFDWIVLKVNQALLAKKHNSDHEGNSIGVLDIFGFEDFGRNSFEQFCINYANEHLQYYFNQHIFKFEQEEYQREGIQWKNIEFIDNTGCLEIFSKRPSGLFHLLDEECNFPGATNDTLLSKFSHNHRGNPYYQVPQLKEGAFNVLHYAGKVKYFVKDFREKNSDLVRPEIVSTMKKSSMTFVRELMGIDPVAVLRWSVVRAFFRCFFAFMNAGERYRENGGAEKKARNRLSDSHLHEANFSESLLKFYHVAQILRVLHKIQSRHRQRERNLAAFAMANLHEPDQPPACSAESGDLDLVCSRRQVLHEELMMYSTMESSLPPSDAKVIRRARRLLMKNKSFKPRPKPSLSFRDIKALKAIASRTMFGGGRMTSSKKQPPSVSAQFQWSLSRLMTTLNQANPFFIRCIKSNSEKAPCQFDDEIVLRQLRYTGMLATVKIRQSGYNYRLLFEEFIQLYQILLPRGLLSSQEDVKTFLSTMHLNMDNCQIGKNKVFLRESEKLLLDESLHTAIMRRVIFIQRWVKARLERRFFLRLKEATITLQKHTRRLLAQRILQRMQSEQDAAITVQRVYRGWRVRKAYRAYRNTIICLQSHLRAVYTRRRFLQAVTEKQQAQQRRAAAAAAAAAEEEEKVRQRQLQLQEELQSTASDEGVMLKGSSAEELEEREFAPVQRRDSEESSGILEDSDSEATTATPDPCSQRESLTSLPPPTPSTSSSSAPPTPEIQQTVGSSPGVSRPPTTTTTTQPPGRREVYLVEAGSASGGGRVQELAKTFQSAPQRDEMDGRTYFVRRGSQRLGQKRFPAPLAKQESFSDMELSPQKDEQTPEATSPPPAASLSPDNLHAIEEAITKGRSSRLEPEEARTSTSSDPSTHLSPLHKARKHIKNFMGGLHLPDMHIHSRSSTAHDARSRRKKDITDSDDEGEDSHHSSSVSSPTRKASDMGVFVLPSAPPQTHPPLPPSQQARKDHPVSLADDGSKQISQVPRAKRKKKQRRRSQGNGGQMTTPQSRSNVNFYGTSEWQYSDDMKITDVQDLHLLDEFISQKCRELFKGGTRRDTIFDKIFRGALDEFGRELKTMIGVEMQHEEVAVKYRDLFEKFKQVLMAEMRREQTEAPLVMALNAFRGFLDEFMKQHSGRRKDKKDERSKPEKPVKRDKQKKDMVEHLGHKFLQVQFSIPTFCEFCSSLIWIMDKGQVCQVCKYTCHKKCSVRSISACRGSSSDQSASNAKVFGAPLESLLREGDKIPVVVERLINAVEMHGLFTEGLYRKSAAAPKARELRTLLELDYEVVKLEEYPVHTLTTVMKSFFRELPEPLLTFELYDDLLRGAEIKDRKEQVQCMFAVIEKLPKANYDLFERLTFHLAKVAMHEDSTKMSVNGLSIIFAPCLLRSNKKIQAQESLNQVPKQTSCIEVILSEELATVKSKLEDISTLESAEKTAEERLSFVRASLKKSRVKADLRPPLPAQGSNEDEDSTTSSNPELAAEARALSAHIATIHKERKDLTSKLPVLETRQASSDEDMLTGDETDSVFDSMDLPNENNEEYAVAFDLPANAPFLRHVTKGRVPIPSRRRPPLRYSKRLVDRHGLHRQAAIPEVLSESPPTICITEYSATESAAAPYVSSTMTVPESDYVNVPGVGADEDEIMV